MPRPSALLAGAALVVVAAQRPTTPVVVPTLPFEFHSFNDLDAWPAAVAAGTRWMKLDIGPCVEASCAAFSTWASGPNRGNASDCFAVGGETYCCLCMRGDASTRPYLADPFNTTWDLIEFLRAPPPALPRWGEGGGQSSSSPPVVPLRIGLDFGGTPECNGAFALQPPCPVFPMVSQWLLAMKAALDESGVAVAPYFDDEMNSWFVNLDVACGPQSPTRASCTPEQIALQAAIDWPAETGPPFPDPSQDPNGRWTIPNDAYQSLANDCKSGTGWWTGADTDARTHGLPYLWWETQDQGEFLTLLDEWAGCGGAGAPNLPPGKTSVNNGTVLVSNVGPAQFEVFTSSRVGRGLNVQFTGGAAASGGSGAGGAEKLAWPLLVSLPALDPAPSSVDRWTVLAAADASGAGTNVSVYVFPVLDGTAPATSLPASPTLVLPLGQGPLAAFAAAKGPAANTTFPFALLSSSASSQGAAAGSSNASLAVLVAATYTGLFAFLTLDVASGALALLGTGTFADPAVLPPGSSLLAAALSCTSAQVPDLSACAAVLAVAGTTAGARDAGAGWLNLTAVALTSSSAAHGGPPLASASVQQSFLPDAGASLVLDGDGAAAGGGFSGLVVYAATPPPNETATRAAQHADASPMAARLASARESRAGGGVRRGRGERGVIDGDEGPSSAAAVGYAPAGSVRSELFAASVAFSFAAGTPPTLSVSRWGIGENAEPRRIGFGSRPHLSSAWPPPPADGPAGVAGPALLLLTSDSPCDCGLLLNNADFSRCQLGNPGVDWNPLYTLFQSVPALLGFNFGALASWTALAAAGPSPASGDAAGPAPVETWSPAWALGPCHPSIAYGKFETGASVSGAVFAWSVVDATGSGARGGGAASPELGLLVVHDGDADAAIETDILCGSPVGKPGLVWDAWRLPQVGAW